MITVIEQRLVERLKRGLGTMVRTVKSYNGEVDDLAAQIMTLPAVWVTYGGSRIETMSNGARYQDTATFAVMIATRNLRNEVAGRQGGIVKREIGANDLIRAVRRLLDGQRLGLNDSRGLTPKAVQTIVNNTTVQAASLSVFAIEYAIRFDSVPLENERFPEKQTAPNDLDYIFTQYQGELSAPYSWFEYMDGMIYDPTNQAKLPIHLELKK